MAENDPNVRLRVFALMLRFGHELFAAEDLNAAAVAAVNNAHELIPFKTSSLFETTDGKVRILAQFAQPTVNPNSEQSLEEGDAVRNWLKDPEGEGTAAAKSRRLIKLPLPMQAQTSRLEFVWLFEFSDEVPQSMDDVLKLMATSAGQALAYHRLCRPRHANLFKHMRKSTLWSGILLLLLAIMFLRVPEAATAEFSVRSPQETTVYAWFDGAIASCLKRDGDRVQAGEVIVKYDVSQLTYRMALAKNQLAETTAELELARQNAFADPNELGHVKLLELRCEGLRVSVDEAKWYVEHSEVRAPAAGVVAIAEGDTDKLENKAVRTGDVLFRVLGGDGFEAEIPVDEREASVLREDLKIQLFLHTAPETAIEGRIVSVSHYPQLTDQKTWAYRVRVALDSATVPGDLRYGMRGIAKLQSGKVSLGYRLFKSGVLYLRGL